MYHDVQHVGSQARPSDHMHHVYGAYGLAGPICIMYHDVQHIGSQDRYARPSAVRHVYGSYWLAGPICIMYHDVQHMVSQARCESPSGSMHHVRTNDEACSTNRAAAPRARSCARLASAPCLQLLR